jgi:uncharacterized protein (DUF2252 family)
MPKSWHQVHARSDGLGLQLVRLENALADKAAYANRLEDLLRVRTERCDQLANTVAMLRQQNKRLSEEADHYCQMLAVSWRP